MKKNFKKSKNLKKTKKENSALSFKEFKNLMQGFTDEEINQVSDWLLNLPRKL